jgi:hypothetical protein
VSLFDLDAKYADVLSLAEVEDWLTQRMVRGAAPPPGA